MLTPQIKGEEGAVGLAFFLGDDHNPDRFGHDGDDEGFQAALVMFADSGQGAAIMGNSEAFFRMEGYVEDAIAKAYGWKSARPQRLAGEILLLVEAAKGTQAALDEYQRVKQGALTGYQRDEGTLNMLGYRLLGEKKIDEAIKVFQLNVEEYPKFWNCYDSLGEGYMNAGKKELAIQNYEKSLELNPKNQNGADMLKKLREDR
jgi:tetratricopeptide (TPR) repeat protein